MSDSISAALASKEATAITASTKRHPLPGDIAMWVFIIMELSVFAIFFFGFAVAQQLNTDMFAQGKATLDIATGLYCTLALICSSYVVVLAVFAIKQGKHIGARNWLIVALLFACVYLVLKALEYSALVSAGYGLSSNTFYTLYFFTTGFHYLHVVLGMIILMYVLVKTHRGGYQQKGEDKVDIGGFEASASYWHMVDLVWVIVFFLIYLIH